MELSRFQWAFAICAYLETGLRKDGVIQSYMMPEEKLVRCPDKLQIEADQMRSCCRKRARLVSVISWLRTTLQRHCEQMHDSTFDIFANEFEFACSTKSSDVITFLK